ncbi:hypothetical protein F9C07_4534 [Aspergillus flavus]|uniref:Uncharacterized protein n=1 Tax=Aspergillus flavus (strain ATCC 200026 / FGSC A1120 / IAM 13836 / NRRL 3357 / JCM 12722 / SRRC 167) TaxID=332952 RepID=A0A7U2QUJ9_ASPFN|nr:hypothetical protein F9C07_4534 [Aspergillus flavus]
MEISIVADIPIIFNNCTDSIDLASIARREGVSASFQYFEEAEENGTYQRFPEPVIRQGIAVEGQTGWPYLSEDNRALPISVRYETMQRCPYNTT